MSHTLATLEAITPLPLEQHWPAAQAYVGREYVPGQYDCAHLAADVQAQVFGRAVHLPAVHRCGRAGQGAQIRALRDELATPIAQAQHGCAVLLRSACGAWHIGTVFVQGSVTWVLHNSARMGSAALTRLADFGRLGLAVEGCYAWK